MIELKVKKLNLYINNHQILNNISFGVERGEILSIIGPSGCGKTSILKCITGIHNHKGNVVLRDIDITYVPINERNITLVFQDYSLFPHMTLEQNIDIGSTDEICNDEILETLGINDLRYKYPHEMSGGEQQRGALARAIAHKPKILLLDEPFSNIDAILTRKLRTKVKELIHSFNITSIMVTHDLEDVYEMSNRCVVIENGKISDVDTVENIQTNRKTPFIDELFSDIHDIDGKTYKVIKK